MASNAKEVDNVTLKVLLDKGKNKVLFAEAGKDFVDILLSMLTLPLGTIARLVAKESNVQPVKLGSVSSLYESVSQLEEKHLHSQTCKEMLLRPRNSLEAYCQQLKLKMDDTDPMKYFVCDNWGCVRKESGSLLSTFKNKNCDCGKIMNREIFPEKVTSENGFVKETASFIICDDLQVMPNGLGTSVDLLKEFGIEDMESVEEKTVEISNKEVLDLLKFSLLSKTPLTDFILTKKQFLYVNTKDQSLFEIGKVPSDKGRQIVVKLLVRKSDCKILFAEANEDFADFLLSFLTLPLGGVLHMLGGLSSLSCFDKLHKSVTELSSDRYLRSQELKKKLANPPCAPQFNLNNHIFPIGVALLPLYYCNSYGRDRRLIRVLVTSPNPICQNGEMNAPLDIIDPKSSKGKSSPCGFVKGPSMFMVTDDLCVSPISSISGVSYLNKSKVGLFELEQRFVTIGLEEGLSILKASLTSTSALTNGLKHFIIPVKDEAMKDIKPSGAQA